jgi:hypothetical protein
MREMRGDRERGGEERRRSREGRPEAIATERDEQDDECGGEREGGNEIRVRFSDPAGGGRRLI